MLFFHFHFIATLSFRPFVRDPLIASLAGGTHYFAKSALVIDGPNALSLQSFVLLRGILEDRNGSEHEPQRCREHR